MKIIKHGDLQPRKFTCNKCGCEFVANMNEYHIKEGGCYKIPDIYTTDCPECGKHVVDANTPLYEEDNPIDGMSDYDIREYCKLMYKKLCELQSEYVIYDYKELIMFRLIIAGGREFDDYALLSQSVDEYISELDDHEIEIVCGCASGADALGARYGRSKGYKINYYKPEWETFGRAAGPIRNEKMAQNADGLVAFWNGASKGTKNMIGLARQYGLKVKVVKY